MTTYNFNLSNYHLSENTCRIANLNFIEETTNRNGEYMLRGLWASDLCYQFAKKCKFTLVQVQLFGDSQRVAVGIGNGIAKVEWRVLLSQIRGAGVDGRGHIVSDRAYSGRGVARLQALGVVCLDPIHHGVPAVGDGVGVGQRVALVHLHVGEATIGAALQNVAAQVAVAVACRSPRDHRRAAALDILRHRDGRRCRRGVVVDHRYLRTGAPARLQTLGVVCLDAVHHGRGAEGDVVRGAGGRTLINLTPRTAAVGRTLYLVAGEIALSIIAFFPRD